MPLGLVIQQAVQTVMVPALAPARLGAIQPHLEPAGHVGVHRLPVPTASKPMWRGTRHGYQHRSELRPHTDRARSQEPPARDRLSRIVVRVPTEVHHLMWILTTRTDTNG